MFSPNSKNKQGIFFIRKLKNDFIIPEFMKNLIKGKNFAILSKNEILIRSHSSTLKLRILNKIDSELVYYLGCYFADGTKKGYVWGIVASTFEQARFFKKMYYKLVSNPQLKSYVSITSNLQVNNEKLMKLWESKSNIKIDNVCNHLSKFEFSANRDEFGSLVIRDYRKCLLNYYNYLLHESLHQILKTRNKKDALNFILGVLEGDGSASAKSRGYISIASNKSDYKILEKILEISGLNFKIEHYSGNKTNIRINALGILSNLYFLPDKIFKYYPKRRKKFIQRFLGVGAVKHFFDEKRKTPAWVKKWLKNEGFVNGKYELTKKSKTFKAVLIKMKKEIK